MELVTGAHYEQVQRVCSDYQKSHCFAFLPGLVMREPQVTPIQVCMDRYEWPNRQGVKPLVMSRFVEAETMCQRDGKRLCTEFEWELACEGAAALPFPYGFTKEPGACNVDELWRPYDSAKLQSNDEDVRDREIVRLYQGAPSGSRPRCKSPFGVYDLVGNVEEWVSTSRPQWPWRSSLKGGYWTKPWAGCRGTNERHGPRFRFYNIGFRCCAAPEPAGLPAR
ncbi:MAG: SUMF1/EgtB/PvdO family nonheme iron enzyme [Deltaproteobacteria bacterium]|nr:SUMF1/EgtB/PvdO family nonheme iron enzyme [Deltaproteobacteria bacterium]MBW2531670.1 SUMF1/EgtB/PvdO family nonheme iron enzyme [Deltaproteobacteria bacterium]